jgi:hypothetical protein
MSEGKFIFGDFGSCSDRGLMQLFLFFLFSMKLSSYFPLSLTNNDFSQPFGRHKA